MPLLLWVSELNPTLPLDALPDTINAYRASATMSVRRLLLVGANSYRQRHLSPPLRVVAGRDSIASRARPGAWIVYAK